MNCVICKLPVDLEKSDAIRICECKAWSHLSCIVKWKQTTNRSDCPTCKYVFQTKPLTADLIFDARKTMCQQFLFGFILYHFGCWNVFGGMMVMGCRDENWCQPTFIHLVYAMFLGTPYFIGICVIFVGFALISGIKNLYFFPFAQLPTFMEIANMTMFMEHALNTEIFPDRAYWAIVYSCIPGFMCMFAVTAPMVYMQYGELWRRREEILPYEQKSV